MNLAISLIAAALISFFAYQFLRGFDFSFSSSPGSRVERFAAADRRSVTDKIGDSLVDRLGLSFDAWKHELRWAQLGGYYEGKTVGSVLGRSVLFVLFGVAYGFFVGFSPVVFGAMALLGYYPYMQLRGKAQEVRDSVKRSLPEAAAMIAAEMSAGSSAETAIQRAAAIPGAFGTLIRLVIQQAQQTGRLIFSQGMIQGVLVEEAASYQAAYLEAFARQIDLVASRGAEGPRQMAEVARSLAREYRSDVLRASEQLGNKLLFPMTIYIFVPFMLSVFVPLMIGVFTMF